MSWEEDSPSGSTSARLNASMDRDIGMREEPMGVGQREKFTTVTGKRIEAIGKELGDARSSITEIRHKLLGPTKTVPHPRSDQPEPDGDMGVLDKIERSHNRIYDDVSALARDLRDLLNRI